jgi:transposase-like protein
MQDPIIVNQAPKRPPRRTYTKEFKLDAVAQCERGDRSLAQVAMDLRINANLIRRWQKEQHDKTAGSALLPVQVAATSSPRTDNNTFLELSVADVTIKVVGNVETQRIVELVCAFR